MDEMNIRSPFMRRMAARYIEKKVNEKFGCRSHLDIQSLNIIVDDDGNVKFSVNANGSIRQEQLPMLLKI